MIDRDDLRASVGAGILTEAQAARLSALADSRRGAREGLDPGDEPFELFKGFNEIFIVVGLIILSTGWIGAVSLYFTGNLSEGRAIVMTASAIGAVVLWALSEYFIRNRRMVAPAIALSILFAGNAAYGFAGAFAELFMIAQGDNSSLPLPMALAIIALLIYWWRFRVPFALALIAVAAFGLAVLVAGNANGAPGSTRELFLLSAEGPFALITLILGLIVFAIAMVFDMSDPHRVTRRAANGFWLHVVAAPALVNTIALSLLDSGSNLVLLMLLTLIAAIAIIIDRRSFLIAAIGYVVILSNTLFEEQNAVYTILALGALLLLLGARWERFRAVLMRMLPGFIPRDRLPPAH